MYFFLLDIYFFTYLYLHPLFTVNISNTFTGLYFFKNVNYGIDFRRNYHTSNREPNYNSSTMDYINKKLKEAKTNHLTSFKEFALKNKKLNWYKAEPLVNTLGPVGDMTNYDYSIRSLLDITDFNKNIQVLEKILSEFNQFNSYSIAFLARNPRDNYIITLGGHFLVNKTTPCIDLLYEVYNKIDELSSRYEILLSDKITVKIRPINFLVKDPVFQGGRVRNTPNLPTDIKLGINYKLLTMKYIPHTMDLKYYGNLVSKQDNVL